MTHAELVLRAARWLRNTKGCGVVLTERGVDHEHPDAIGWRGAWSILVECKTSRSDFLADAKKPHRIESDLGMGQERYYMTVPFLLDPLELPAGWGLLEVLERRVRVALPALVPVPGLRGPLNNARTRWELPLLVSAMRQVQLGIEPTYGIDAPVIPASPDRLRSALTTRPEPCQGSQP